MAVDIDSFFTELVELSDLMFGDDYETTDTDNQSSSILHQYQCVYQCFERHKWCFKHW